MATLPGAWLYRVSAGTGQPGVSILWLGEVESWICNFYLSVAACKTCLSRSVPEIHKPVAGTLSNQPTNQLHMAKNTNLRRLSAPQTIPPPSKPISPFHTTSVRTAERVLVWRHCSTKRRKLVIISLQSSRPSGQCVKSNIITKELEFYGKHLLLTLGPTPHLCQEEKLSNYLVFDWCGVRTMPQKQDNHYRTRFS